MHVRTLFLLLLLAVPSLAQDATEPQQLNDDALQEIIAERDRLWAVCREYTAQEQLSEAIIAARSALQLQRKHLGADEPDVFWMLDAIATLRERQQDYAGVAATWQEMEPLAAKIFGPQHWRSIDAHLSVALFQQIAKLDAADHQRVAEARQLDRETVKLQEAGQFREALILAQKGLDIRLALFGRENVLTSTSLTHVGNCYAGMGDYRKAEPLFKESLELRERLYGNFHPATLVSLHNLASFYNNTNQFDRAEPGLKKLVEINQAMNGPQHPDTVQALTNLGTFYLAKENYRAAEPILLDALKLQRELYGDEHFQVAKNLERLGAVYSRKGEYVKAEQTLNECLRLYEKLVGEEHPATADALDVLGSVQQRKGDFARSQETLERALRIRRHLQGETHPDVAGTLRNLGQLAIELGNLPQAERYYRQALELSEKAYGEKHLQTADALSSLASLYASMRDFGRAESYCQRALNICRDLVGEKHPDTATRMIQLGGVLKEFGKLAEAEAMYKQALENAQAALGPQHPQLAGFLNAVAMLYESKGDYAQAGEYYRQALVIQRKQMGDQHPETALVLCNLGRTVFKLGDYQRAQTIITGVLDIYHRTLSPTHAYFVEALTTAGSTKLALGEPKEAARLLQQALSIARHELDAVAAVQSERQQLLLTIKTRHVLNLYLAAAQAAQVPVEQIYAQSLLWKGAVLARQLHDRGARRDDDAPLTAELQQISVQLANASLRVPDPSEREAWLAELARLKERGETLETELTYQSRQLQAKRAIATVTPAKLCEVLPAGTALVDVIGYDHPTRYDAGAAADAPDQPRYLAFVLRPDRPIVQVDLHAAQPIDEAIEKWRRTRGFESKKGPTENPAVLIRQLVWQPLVEHLEGCGTVLVSPDAGLTRMALTALPGDEPGSYLIEQVAIAVIPVPQVLPELVEKRDVAEPSMLLVGDIDYDAKADDDKPSEEASAEGGLATFTPLKGAGPEIHAVADLFHERFAQGSSLLLEKQSATEVAFRREAPSHSMLHVATHGFFAPPNVTAAITVQEEWRGKAGVGSYVWGLISGLALAGANAGSSDAADNGILTASEVAALDLRHVELAVLSGCETGLGQISVGEGTFGTQRAFQLAGVRSTVSSLWNVPDETTRQLMQQFYENLWDKKLSKLEALRQAQLAILQGDGTARKAPHYWAAFFLSGDWR